MSPRQWNRARELFSAAIRQNASQADEYLRSECGGDVELLSEVRRMVAEHERTGTLDGQPWIPAERPPDSTQPVFSAGQLVAGRYRIVRYLSRGGMGEVYEAEHPLLPDRVALKTLLPAIASDESMIARFKQEIQLARKIAHPHVCKVFDLEWHESAGGRILFLTMELLGGETLSARIERAGRFAPDDALPLLEQMAGALDAAHRAGVVHRDFKASNVMLVASGGGIRAVVTDFGLARAVSTGDDSTGSVSSHLAGTFDYMAPELLTGSVATPRSDTYALGMVAYKMVAGALPFAGEPPLAGAVLRSRKPVPSPRTLVPGLDTRWEQAILRALDRDPGRRFASAAEFPRALRGEAASVTVPLPMLTRRRILAAAGFTAMLAAGGIGWRTWRLNRLRPGPEGARLYQQGVDDIHAGAYFAATKALDQAVELTPQFSPARARLAEAWLELDLPEKAAIEFLPVRRQDNSALSRLESLQIEAVDLTLTRESAAAVAKYQQMLAQAGPDAADVNIDLGRACEKAGRQEEAIAAYRRAAEGPAHSAAAWLRLGVLYNRRKDSARSEAAFAEADRRYQQASNLEGLTELTLQRGVAANRDQKYAEAAPLLRQAMERAHEVGNLHQEISARLTLANVAYATGDEDKAESLAKEALAAAQMNQMEPLAIRGFFNLGSALYLRGDYTGAEQNLQQALTLATRTGSTMMTARTQLSLASLHDRLHRSQDQIREANSALEYFQPHHWVQETFYGLMLLGRGELYRENFPAALSSLQQALDAASRAQDRGQMAQAYEGLGDLSSAQDDYPHALEYYGQFLKIANPMQTAYAAIECARMLVKLGRYEEAVPEFARAEEAAARFPVIRANLSGARAEMALIRGDQRQAAALAVNALAIPSLRPLAEADLTRTLGLALLRSGDRKAGLAKCEKALAVSREQNDPGALLNSRMAVLEARLAMHDVAGATDLFHELEPALEAHPEHRWRAFALLAHSNAQYADRSREALGKLKALWGRDAFDRYLKRPEVQELSVARFPLKPR